MSADHKTTENTLLVLDQVRVLYGKHCVLRVPSLSLASGGLLLLRGPNGSGKSSLLKGLAGIGPTLEGKTSFMRKDLATLSAAERARSGLRLLPQGRRVFSRLTAEEHVALAWHQLAGRRPSNDKTPTWLQRIWGSRRIAEGASGGESKTILLQSLLAPGSRLMMLDEPFAGLDEDSTARVASIVHSARVNGVAWLVTDHTGFAQKEFRAADVAEILATPEGNVLRSQSGIKERYE